jgi:hypothetical protein
MKIRKQRGLTLIGFGIVLVLVLFFAYVGMRIVPMYLEYHAVVNAMELLQKDPGAAQLSPNSIRRRILNTLWVSYATDNIKREHIKISRRDGVQVRIVYEVRKPLLANLDIVGRFDKTVTLR